MGKYLIIFITVIMALASTIICFAESNGNMSSNSARSGAGPAAPDASNMMCTMGSMAVDDSSIYILRNGQLMKLNKITMQVVSSTNIPAPGSATTASTAPAMQTEQNITTPATEGAGPNAAVNNTNAYSSQNPNYNPSTSSPYTGPVQGTMPGAVTSQGFGSNIQAVQPQAEMMQPSGTTQGMPAMMGAGPGMACPSTVAVDAANVYILQGNQVLRFDKTSLQLNNTTTLPAEGTAIQATTGAGPAATEQKPSAMGAGPTVSVDSISNTCPPAQVTLAPLGPCTQQTITSMSALAPIYQEQMYMNTMYQSHLGAIAWSELAAQKATKLELRRFAKNVIDRETRVNNQFINWLQGWYGMRPVKIISNSDAQSLRNMQRLCGTDFDIAYMQDMIIHFSGAIALSSALTSAVPHCQVKNMATIMANEHATDMNQLRTWLADWYNVK